MSQGTITLNDIERAVLLSQHGLIMASLMIAKGNPHLRAGAIHYLGALEDTLQLPRTFPPREERQREREFARDS